MISISLSHLNTAWPTFKKPGHHIFSRSSKPTKPTNRVVTVLLVTRLRAIEIHASTDPRNGAEFSLAPIEVAHSLFAHLESSKTHVGPATRIDKKSRA
jgi:hypothetical protein